MPVHRYPARYPAIPLSRTSSKFLLKSVQSHNPDALLRVREFHPQPDNALLNFSLSDAQLVVARNYGLPVGPGQNNISMTPAAPASAAT